MPRSRRSRESTEQPWRPVTEGDFEGCGVQASESVEGMKIKLVHEINAIERFSEGYQAPGCRNVNVAGSSVRCCWRSWSKLLAVASRLQDI